MTRDSDAAIAATCHCGAVTVSLTRAPTELADCNCSLCRRYGVLWSYHPAAEVSATPDPPPTQTYARNGCHVDFYHCRQCGCVTH